MTLFAYPSAHGRRFGAHLRTQNRLSAPLYTASPLLHPPLVWFLEFS